MFNNNLTSRHRAEQIKGALDALAVINCVSPDQMAGVFDDVINTLCGYPKPQPKQSDTPHPEADPADLAAYLFVSMARNTAKLACIGSVCTTTAPQLIEIYLSNALSVIID